MSEEAKRTINRKIIYSTIIISFFLTVVMVSMQSGNRKLNSLLDLGQKYLEEMDYESAIAVFDQAISIEAKCEEAYLGKATAQYALGQYHNAADTLKQGIEAIDHSSELEELLKKIEDEISTRNNDLEMLHEEIEMTKVNSSEVLLLNYSQIVRYTNTEKPEIQLEVIHEDEKEQDFIWTSSDEKCATVSNDGLVTCKSEDGYAYISVTDGIRTAGCQVIILDSQNAYMKEEETICVNKDEVYIGMTLEENKETGVIDRAGCFPNYVYYSGDFIIPESLSFNGIEYKIEEVSERAFYACENLETVFIPATIETLGGEYEPPVNSFRDCPKLKEINVDEDNAFYKSKNGILFSEDETVLISYPSSKEGKTYIIPEEVEVISYGAFSDNRNLEELFIEGGEKTLRFEIGTDSLWKGVKNKIVVSGIENLKSLESLQISTSAVADMEMLSALNELRELYIYEDSKKLDFGVIEKMSNLESLSIYEMDVLEDLSWISNMKELRNVYISVEELGNVDLTPLGELPQLTSINIGLYNWDGSQIILDEQMIKQIEELKEVRPEAYINILEN